MTKKLKRGLTVSNLQAKKYELLPFEEGTAWHDAYKQPQQTGIIIVWGNSGNGKTQFIIDLIKELGQHYKILFNSLEEGSEHTLAVKSVETGLSVVEKNLLIVEESIEDLEIRLDKPRSPHVVIIDSLQYTDINKAKYEALKAKYKHKKLIIFISHADGKEPKGSTAQFIRYDAMQKIHVEGFRAISMGRYTGTTGYYTIWDEGAARHWGTETEQ